jgi:hypothetical protein
MYPRVKVSLDGRYEVAYAPQVFGEHWEFFQGGPDWLHLLDQYPHDAVLVHQSAKVRPLLETFRRSTNAALTQPSQASARSGWRIAFEDDAYIILARADSPLPYEDRRGQSVVDRTQQAFSLNRGQRSPR